MNFDFLPETGEPQESQDSLERHIRALMIAMEQRDKYNHDHSTRVKDLAILLGKDCALSERELQLLHIAATFHDIGKIGIPDKVLLKEGSLDKNEWAIMKTHSEKSSRIVFAIDIDERELVAATVRHHHERFDGHGYPDELIGEDIPVMARILSIVDAYDAMAKKRVYASAKSHSQIMEELTAERGAQHDPYLIAKFTLIINDSENARFRAQENSSD